MLTPEQRELCLQILETPRRAHNQKVHQRAADLIDADLRALVERKDPLAIKLSIRLLDVPQALTGEYPRCAFRAGDILEERVKAMGSAA